MHLRQIDHRGRIAVAHRLVQRVGDRQPALRAPGADLEFKIPFERVFVDLQPVDLLEQDDDVSCRQMPLR